MIYYVT